MKTRNLILLCLAASLGAPLSLKADTVAETMKKAEAAEKAGDVKTAHSAYEAILKVDPSNPNARVGLFQLNANQNTVAARGRAKELSEIQIEKVDFDNVDLSAALETLGGMVERASGEKKYAANYMIQDPSGKLGEKTLTLKVKNVPATEVLKMMLAQTGGKARYEEHAVIITPDK